MVAETIEAWFTNRQISTFPIYNESSTHIIIAGTKNSAMVSEMIDNLSEFFQDNHIHISTKRVRGGTAIGISQSAISEDQFTTLLSNHNIMLDTPNFMHKLDEAMTYKLSFIPKKIKTLPTRLFSIREEMEDINGLFSKFSKALEVLGKSLNINIKELLSQQGIKWDKSKDNTSIVLYLMNAVTNAPQPIARISADTLQKPHDFEQQLMSMIDFAKGQAPGTENQIKQELQNQEKAVREISKAAIPDENPEAQQMQQDLGTQAPAEPQMVPEPMQAPQKPMLNPATQKLR